MFWATSGWRYGALLFAVAITLISAYASPTPSIGDPHILSGTLFIAGVVYFLIIDIKDESRWTLSSAGLSQLALAAAAWAASMMTSSLEVSDANPVGFLILAVVAFVFSLLAGGIIAENTRLGDFGAFLMLASVELLATVGMFGLVWGSMHHASFIAGLVLIASWFLRDLTLFMYIPPKVEFQTT